MSSRMTGLGPAHVRATGLCNAENQPNGHCGLAHNSRVLSAWRKLIFLWGYNPSIGFWCS